MQSGVFTPTLNFSEKFTDLLSLETIRDICWLNSLHQENFLQQANDLVLYNHMGGGGSGLQQGEGVGGLGCYLLR